MIWILLLLATLCLSLSMKRWAICNHVRFWYSVCCMMSSTCAVKNSLSIRGRKSFVRPQLCVSRTSEFSCAIITALRVAAVLCTSSLRESHMSQLMSHSFFISSFVHRPGCLLLCVTSRCLDCTTSNSFTSNPSMNAFGPRDICSLLALTTGSVHCPISTTISSSLYACNCFITAIFMSRDVVLSSHDSKFRCMTLYAVVARLLWHFSTCRCVSTSA
mmetsp:Transcript_17274/g.25155  ORF Transcript_17274/g.25155 Transcript_17274/m.25155 type:complete len:217 (+) Transcript_17274:268-918(+)